MKNLPADVSRCTGQDLTKQCMIKHKCARWQQWERDRNTSVPQLRRVVLHNPQDVDQCKEFMP